MIAMRVIQGAGGAAVLSVGAGSIADVFDAHERGRKVQRPSVDLSGVVLQ
jgi:MFS family permease